MFKKLFGSSDNAQKKKQAQPQVSVQDAADKLGSQIETVDKRAKVLENKVNDLKRQALEKKKNKDNRGNYILISIVSYRRSTCYEINEDA